MQIKIFFYVKKYFFMQIKIVSYVKKYIFYST